MQKHRTVKLEVYLGYDLVANCASLKYVLIDNNEIKIKVFYKTYNMRKSMLQREIFGRVTMPWLTKANYYVVKISAAKIVYGL